VVVVGVAGDDGAEDCHRVDVVPPGEAIRGQRRVVRAGHLDGLDDRRVAVGCRLTRALGHLLRDATALVEPGDDQPEPYHGRSGVIGAKRCTVPGTGS
jgi:hypothetical protein